MFCLDTNVIVFAMNLRRPGIAERLEAELATGTQLVVPAIVRFELEYGYGAIEIHEPDWSMARHDRISAWGHHRV